MLRTYQTLAIKCESSTIVISMVYIEGPERFHVLTVATEAGNVCKAYSVMYARIVYSPRGRACIIRSPFPVLIRAKVTVNN